MQRVTITIDDDLDAELDRFMSTRGYDNRSEAIRDLARSGLQQAAMGSRTASLCGGAGLCLRPRSARVAEAPHPRFPQTPRPGTGDPARAPRRGELHGSHGAQRARVRRAALCRPHHCRARGASWARGLSAVGRGACPHIPHRAWPQPHPQSRSRTPLLSGPALPLQLCRRLLAANHLPESRCFTIRSDRFLTILFRCRTPRPPANVQRARAWPDRHRPEQSDRERLDTDKRRSLNLRSSGAPHHI